MNGLLLIGVGLTAVVGLLCTGLYSRSHKLAYLILEQKEQLIRLEMQFQEVLELHKEVKSRVDSLATDVLQREIYRSSDDRHKLAIKDASDGFSLHELVLKHGLSSDEAALIVALHGKSASPINVDAQQLINTAMKSTVTGYK